MKEKDLNYASKGMLKIIISNINFWAGCVLAMNALSSYKTDGVGSFPKILNYVCLKS